MSAYIETGDFGDDEIARLRAENDRLRAALATPDSPPIHEHRPEYPSTCAGCEHLAADLVSRAPDWMLPARLGGTPMTTSPEER